jgi:hypothetical protein
MAIRIIRERADYVIEKAAHRGRCIDTPGIANEIDAQR